MAEAVLESSSSTALEQYILLSKNTKGAACVELIRDATSAPGVFVFSELLEMPNIQAVCKVFSFFFYFSFNAYTLLNNHTHLSY